MLLFYIILCVCIQLYTQSLWINLVKTHINVVTYGMMCNACLCVLKIGSKLRADFTGVTPLVSPVSLSIANKSSWCLRIPQPDVTSDHCSDHCSELWTLAKLVDVENVENVEAHALNALMKAERRIDPEDGQAARSAVGSAHCRTSVQKMTRVAQRNIRLTQPHCINVNKK